MKTIHRPGRRKASLDLPHQPAQAIRAARRLLPLALAASITFLVSGCMVGPDYHRPQVAVPTQWKELPG